MASKNEAKIRFTAETGEFNSAIKKSNDQMSELRAELKLNEAQMKTSGKSVEGLEQKHEILSKQLQASQNKTEALNQKVDKAVEIYGENSAEVSKLRTQLLNAQSAEEKIKQAIQACNTELSEQKTSANEVESATEKLTKTISEQQKKVDDLKEEYVEAVLQYGKNSREAKDLAKELKKLSGELSDSKSEMAQATGKADKLDKSLDSAGDSAEGAQGGFTILGGAIADLASSAIQGAIGKLSEFIGYLGELPSATMELRQDLGTLTTSFDNVGMSSGVAKDTWKELYAVFGEDDRAVETANHIARMADNQKELNDWVTITTGVWATYQDSLPVEGLAEASSETAKTGKVTGVLADALNWSSEASAMFADYMGEDVVTAEDAFNEALKECTTEQERQTLITDTLTKLYGDSAETYRDTTKAQMEAKEATADQILAEANLASAIEPVTTKFSELKTALLEDVTPAIEKVSGALTDAVGWLSEHPAVVKAVAVTVGVLAVALGILTGVVLAYTVAQWAMNSAILANPITWIVMGIIAVIAILAGVIVLIIEYWDEISAGAIKCWETVKETLSGWGEWINTNVVQPVIKWFKDLWQSVKDTFQNIKQKISDTWENIKTKTTNTWNNIKSGITNTWENIKTTISNAITNAKEKVSSVWDNIKTKTTNTFNNVKSTVTNVWNNIKSAITKPIETAKTTVTKAIDKIKSAFDFDWSLPKPKLPRFSVSGGKAPWGFMGKGSLPKVSVEWYASGGIFTKPTIFSTPYGLKGVGEAGAEAVLPIDRLEGYIAGAIEKTMQVADAQSIVEAVADLANRPIVLNVNGRNFATATANDTDSVNGLRTTFKNRGLVLG